MQTSIFRIAALLALTTSAAPGFAQGNGANAVEAVTVHATAHFVFDRSNVLPRDQKSLLAEVASMKNVTWKTVTAEGHADSVGSRAYNQSLSVQRAEAVRAFLLGKGLDPAMVHATGAGDAHPVASNGTSAGRARNRRAEVTFEGVRTLASAH